MWRGLAAVLCAVALASSFAIGASDAAVAQSVETLVRAQLKVNVKAGSTPAAAPAGKSAPQRSRARTAMAVLEDSIIDRMNQVRRSHGLRPLRANTKLRAASLFHSRDMGRRGYFEHDSISGTAFWRRIERFYPSRGFRSWTVGENLLWGTDTYDAAFAVREWMNSPPHRENILSRDWREVGIGAVYFANAGGEYRGRRVTIVTADFGARR
jgi:uncharacterized protein YkwD